MTRFYAYCLDHRCAVSSKQKPDDAEIVILTYLWERSPIDDTLNFLAQEGSKYPNAKIIIIINSWFKQYQTKLESVVKVIDVVFVDYFLLLLHNRVFNVDKQPHVQTWEPLNDKFLFLTGKPEKINRIRLLWLFKRSGLIRRAVWSFFCHQESITRCASLVPELSKKSLEEFAKNIESSPDGIVPMSDGDKLHYNGVPFDHAMYANSKFQVISETNFDNLFVNNAFITEKTWLAILNCRPFIMAAEPGALAKLQDMGFRTFTQYLLIKDYDSIVDAEQRLHSILKNTKFWLDNIENFKVQIADDVKHNYEHFFKLVEQNRCRLLDVINYYLLDCNIDQIVRLYDSHVLKEIE